MKKKVKVVMLPTEKASNIFKTKYGLGLSIPQIEQTKSSDNQHLYFLSDEEIKEGDWILDALTPLAPTEIMQVTKDDLERCIDNYRYGSCRKIIATTNPELNPNASSNYTRENGVEGLPRPSNEFLKKYCVLGGIDEVLVEYESYCIYGDECPSQGAYDKQHLCDIDYKLKVAPDNTITIYPIK